MTRLCRISPAGRKNGGGGDGGGDKQTTCFPFNLNSICVNPAAAALPVVYTIVVTAKATASGYNITEGVSFSDIIVVEPQSLTHPTHTIQTTNPQPVDFPHKH